jgi:adenylylsulfate kinase
MLKGEVMKILIFGLPGSGKTTLAKPLAELLGGININADEVRTEYDDWDFSPEGRMRQANRMKHLSDGVVKAGKIAVTDFVAPTAAAREAFNPDYTIWMDTISRGRFEDTNDMFETPDGDVDYHVSEWFDDTHETLMQVISSWMKRNV